MAKRTHACSHILMHVCLAPLAQEKHCDAKLKNVDNYDLATFLRQRLAFLESEEGPYAISGAEMRRALSNHSWQLSHSCLSSASPDFEHTPHSGEERHMASCCICAQVLWREQLFDLHLFTEPAERTGGSDPAEEDQSGAKNFVASHAVKVVDSFLSVESYAARWPKMPYRELLATSVQHPFLASRWLLDTKSYREHLDDHNAVVMSADGSAPPVRACSVCRHALCRPRPTLPWCALANDFLMLREPSVFRTDTGAVLSDATLLFLSLARPFVKKVIAEKHKEGDQKERHQSFVGNTISFPQADTGSLLTSTLPAAHDTFSEYLVSKISVVFCGASLPKPLRFPPLEIKKAEFLAAARFLIAHNAAYEHVVLDTKAADQVFNDAVPDILRSLIQVLPDDSEPLPQQAGAAEASALYRDEADQLIEEHDEPDSAPQLLHADTANSSSKDPLMYALLLASKVQALVEDAGNGTVPDAKISSNMKRLVEEFGKETFLKRLQAASTTEEDGSTRRPYVRKAGGQPLTFWEPDFWTKSFPYLFPYGDGVYGLSRRVPIQFHQWITLLLRRSELYYECPKTDPEHPCPLAASSSQVTVKTCAVCTSTAPTTPLATARWSSCRDFLFVAWDCWRRLETMRATKMHVERKGFGQDLATIAKANSSMLGEAIRTLGSASMTTLFQSQSIAFELKKALRSVFLMTSHVVGSDGARVQLRHEQTAMMARFGPLGAFITMNVNDLGHPLLIEMFDSGNGLKGHTTLDSDGKQHKYNLSLLEETPSVPSKRAVATLCAADPVTQARFFIIMYQLFLTHILGLGPVDDLLRHNGFHDGVVYGDGFAASFCNGSCPPIAAAHFPIEEQGRLSCHGHGTVIFVSDRALSWFRETLDGQTADAKQRLSEWRTQVLRSVETVQNTCAGVTPRLLIGCNPDYDFESPHYSDTMRKADHYDGSLLKCAKHPEARHLHVAVQNKHLTEAESSTDPAVPPRDRPQTGFICSTLPHFYRSKLSKPLCDHECCSAMFAGDEYLSEEDVAAGFDKTYCENFSRDFLALKENCCMHVHTASCYKNQELTCKYQGHRNCRFGFQHSEEVWLKVQNTRNRTVDRLYTVLRSGKPLEFPCFGQPPLPIPDTGAAPSHDLFVHCDGTTLTGPRVVPNTAGTDPGRIKTNQLHPREGSTMQGGLGGPRCNLDYQDLRSVLEEVDGLESLPLYFQTEPTGSAHSLQALLVHYLRDPGSASTLHLSRLAGEHLRSFTTAAELGRLTCSSRRQRWLLVSRRGNAERPRIGDRCKSDSAKAFASLCYDHIVDMLRTCKAISFYVCTYTTKPNIKTSHLLENMQRGMQRLEQEVENEEDKALVEEVTKQHKAKRTLYRLWSAANYSMHKGPVLQCIQLLTRREAFKTHRFWQVNLKKPIWLGSEADRRTKTGLQMEPDLELEPVTDITAAAEEEGSVKVLLQGTSFFDDWLHRGHALNWMCHYFYAQYVSVVPLTADPGTLISFRFQEHYGKYATHQQLLLRVERIPVVSGFTNPLPSADPETNALFHRTLFAPAECKGTCDDVVGIGSQWLLPNAPDQKSFSVPWRLYRPYLQVLFMRAEAKKRAERLYPILYSTTQCSKYFVNAGWYYRLHAEIDTAFVKPLQDKFTASSPLPEQDVDACIQSILLFLGDLKPVLQITSSRFRPLAAESATVGGTGVHPPRPYLW